MNNDLHMLSIDINNWNLINRQVVIYTWHLAVDLWRCGYGQWSTQQKEHWLQQQMNWKAQKYIDQNIVSLLKVKVRLLKVRSGPPPGGSGSPPRWGSGYPPQGGSGYPTPPPQGGLGTPPHPPGGVRVPPRGGTLPGGSRPPCRGGGSYLYGVQAATELFWCELALYSLMPHGIMGNVAKHHGSKKKKNYGMGTPPPVDRQIDGWTDTCQNITFPSYYVRGR